MYLIINKIQQHKGKFYGKISIQLAYYGVIMIHDLY